MAKLLGQFFENHIWSLASATHALPPSLMVSDSDLPVTTTSRPPSCEWRRLHIATMVTHSFIMRRKNARTRSSSCASPRRCVGDAGDVLQAEGIAPVNSRAFFDTSRSTPPRFHATCCWRSPSSHRGIRLPTLFCGCVVVPLASGGDQLLQTSSSFNTTNRTGVRRRRHL